MSPKIVFSMLLLTGSMALKMNMQGSQPKLIMDTQQDLQQFTSRMLFGIKTGNKSFSGGYSERSLALQEMVKAQQATWGRNMTREQFIIVGGINDDGNAGLSSQLVCDDVQSGLNCREAVIIDRAINRAATRKSDWLVVTEDDHYFFLKSFQHHLAGQDPEKPQVFTFGFGCGQTAKGGSPSCPAVNEGGGICAGGSYIISRGALQLMRAGKSSEDFIHEFENSSINGQSDLTVSCMFYKRKIPMTLIESRIKEVGATTPEEQDKEISTLAQDMANFMPTVHFTSSNKSSIPSYMRKVASQPLF